MRSIKVKRWVHALSVVVLGLAAQVAQADRVYTAISGYQGSGSQLVVMGSARNNTGVMINVGANPTSVTANATGTRIYVANTNSNTVSVVDPATNTLLTTIPVSTAPAKVVVNLQGTRVYVTHTNSNVIGIINTSNNSYSTVTLPGLAAGIAVNPAGTIVYVADTNNNVVRMINTSTNQVLSNVINGYSNFLKPYGLAFNPSGTRLYVGNQGDNSIRVIDPANNSQIGWINISSIPKDMVVHPSGTRLYVINGKGISVINTANNTVVTSLSSSDLSSNPQGGITINSFGTRVYLTDGGNNSIRIIDTASNTELPSVFMGANPTGIAVGSHVRLVNVKASAQQLPITEHITLKGTGNTRLLMKGYSIPGTSCVIDPIINLVRDSTGTTWTNDNWGTPIGTLPITTATPGAFGQLLSTDSGLLIDVLPGDYTVILTQAGSHCNGAGKLGVAILDEGTTTSPEIRLTQFRAQAAMPMDVGVVVTGFGYTRGQFNGFTLNNACGGAKMNATSIPGGTSTATVQLLDLPDLYNGASRAFSVALDRNTSGCNTDGTFILDMIQ